jgi:hypothetical protein
MVFQCNGYPRWVVSVVCVLIMAGGRPGSGRRPCMPMPPVSVQYKAPYYPNVYAHVTYGDNNSYQGCEIVDRAWHRVYGRSSSQDDH